MTQKEDHTGEEEKVEESEEVAVTAVTTPLANGSFGSKDDAEVVEAVNDAEGVEAVNDGFEMSNGDDVEKGEGGEGEDDDNDDEDDDNKKKRKHMVVPADAPWKDRMWEGTCVYACSNLWTGIPCSLAHVEPTHPESSDNMRPTKTNVSLHYVLAVGFGCVRRSAGSRCHPEGPPRRAARLARRGAVHGAVCHRPGTAGADVDAARHLDCAQPRWASRWAHGLHAVELTRIDRFDCVRYTHQDLHRPE